jgi:hypothetical protein
VTPEAGLEQARDLTNRLAVAREDVEDLLRERDELWATLNRELRVSKKAIAEACGLTPDAVYQGLRRADGNPVARTS